MAIPVTNFGLVTVSTGYGSSDTSIVLTTGHGSKLPATTGGYRYPLTWWNNTDYAHPADDPNVEIILVTGRTGDTLTVTRAQEGTGASTKNTATKTYRMSLGVTKAMWEGARPVRNTHQGLCLQTDRNFPDSLKQVELTAVEYLVMDDGTISDNTAGGWTGLTADITVTGAGGLDVGTDAPNVWYEIYGIEKEDGTRNLLLHRSKQWYVNTNYSTGDDSSYALRSQPVSLDTDRYAQGFTCESGLPVSVDLKLLRIGSPTGNVWVTIESDSGGLPSGSASATSFKLDVSKIPTAATWVRFTFDTASILSASPTLYHIVIQADYDRDVAHCLAVRVDQTSPLYANGAMAIFDGDGSGWHALAGNDLVFSLLTERHNTAITMPTGYVKKCFLGYVYNNGSWNLTPFLQMGTTWRHGRLSTTHIVADLDGTVQLVTPDIPPRELCAVSMGCAGTGTQAGLVVIGDNRATDLSMSGTTTGAMAILDSGGTSTRPGGFTEVVVQRGFFMAHGVTGAKLWIAGFSW